MARYGRDYGRDRWSGYGQGGYGGEYGGNPERGFSRGEYGGMGSDAGMGGSRAFRGRNDFGTGGGAYDADFDAGYGGYGFGGGGFGSGGGTMGRGLGGAYRGGPDYGYGADTGFSGGGYGGTESDWGRGRDLQRGGYGYGGQGGWSSGGRYEGGGYGGGAGYTGGGMGYGGWGGGSDLGGGTGYGEEVRRMRAADVMTDNPECVTPDATLADAARKMRDLDVGIIPVVESEGNRRLRGVLTDRDIAIRAVAEGLDAGSTRVMEVMTTEVETCNKNDSLRDVLDVMEREQVRRVPITDREGRLVGIIAQADVATEIDSPQGQRRVADTLESISEPGNPRRGWGGGRASQGRGRGGGGFMGAVRSAVRDLGGGARGSGATRETGMTDRSGGGNNDTRAVNDPGSENV